MIIIVSQFLQTLLTAICMTVKYSLHQICIGCHQVRLSELLHIGVIGLPFLPLYMSFSLETNHPKKKTWHINLAISICHLQFCVNGQYHVIKQITQQGHASLKLPGFPVESYNNLTN